MREFPLDPDVLVALVDSGEAQVLWGAPDWGDREEGADRADALIAEWTQNEQERAFLEALSAGHEIAEARRLSGLTRSRADRLIRRIRESDTSRKHT